MPKTVNLIRREGLRLHDAGLWIIPCDGKRCISKQWQSKRRTREELAKSLADGKRNIGLVISQTVCIDCECDTPEGEQALINMFGGEIPPTPTWTSRRGKHRLFVRPEGIPRKAVIDVNGVGFRIGNGKGCYSVIPPSVHPDGPKYEWVDGLTLDDVSPAELPRSIVDQLKAVPKALSVPGTDANPKIGVQDIPKGKRNTTLYLAGCQLRQMGLPNEAIADTLLKLNEKLCKPPLEDDEVQKIAQSVVNGDGKAGGDFVERLVSEIELWHDQNGDPFATLKQGEHKENWLIGSRSRPFKRWVSKRFYDATKTTASSNFLSDVCAMLEGKAVFDGPEYFLFRRTAQHEGKFYLDLCDEEWRCIEIDADGWRVVSDPPVKFRRAKAMQALPIPIDTDGAELKDLLSPFLNVKEEQWPLVVSWLVAAFRPTGPYPVLKLLGEHGSAKTTTARVLRSLVDPNSAPVRAEPRSTRDLMIASNNGWILCMDNLSIVKADLSDAICRLATGGGFATRTLYSDDEETIFDAQRPVILTSIEEIGTRSDLLERSLIIELPSIDEKQRRAEKEFWADFEKVKPRILGALLDIVAGAIRRLPEIEAKAETELPRLADFHVFGEAAETFYGLEPGAFAESYAANREAATQIALESNPAVAALLKLLQKNPTVEDTSTGLLNKLSLIDGSSPPPHGWPKNARAFSAIVKRVAPNLRQIGITATQGFRGGGDSKEKVWRFVAPWDSPVRKPAVNKTAPKSGSQKRKGSKKAHKVSSGKPSGLAASIKSKLPKGS